MRAAAGTFDEVVTALRLPADAVVWREGWADSQEAYDVELMTQAGLTAP